MKNIAASFLDLILMCSMLMIGSIMLANSWHFMSESITEVENEDKTAIKNYTGNVANTFDYTGQDLILSIVIGDHYEPPVAKLNIKDVCTINADPEDNSNGTYANSYVNKDRITYIKEIWPSLKNYNNTNAITYSRIWEVNDYIWYVTTKSTP